MFERGHSVHTPSTEQLESSSLPSPWSWLKRLFSFNKQDGAASVQEQGSSGSQPDTDAQDTHIDITPPVKEDQPSSRVVHLAAGPQAPSPAHLEAAKQGSAAQLGDDAQPDLLKAHRGAASDSAAEPDQAAQGGAKPNKRKRRAAKRAAERAAAAAAEAAALAQSEADNAHALPIVHEQGGAAGKGDAVKAAAPTLPTLEEPAAPPTSKAAAPALHSAVQADTVAPAVTHKKEEPPRNKHVTGMLMMCYLLS